MSLLVTAGDNVAVPSATARTAEIAEHGPSATPVLVITGWVIVSTVAGTLITKRRAVS
ncbi:MAG: hypothetical protein ABWY29_13430 [Blastococcus sp.]